MATVLAALISAVATILIAVGAGIFAVIQWKDQRTRELQEQRFEQYWKLIDTSQETPFLAKQTIALLLLKRYPDFKKETVAYLTSANKDHGWFKQNTETIGEVFHYFNAKD